MYVRHPDTAAWHLYPCDVHTYENSIHNEKQIHAITLGTCLQ